MKTIHLYFLAHVVMLIIGAITTQLTHTWAAEIGIGLIVAGVSGGIFGLYVVSNQSVARLLETLRIFGFEEAWEGRGARIRDAYELRLRDLQNNLDVIGFGLRSFREDFSQRGRPWTEKISVRILLLDPDFPSTDLSVAQQRDREERNTPGTIASDVRQFVREFRDLIAARDGRFEVRLYQCIPSINIFRVDQHMFWGPYLINDQSRNMPTFLIRAGSPLFQTYMNHFDQIWNEWSREVPPEWLENP